MNAIKQELINDYNKAIAELEKQRDLVDLLPDALVELPGAMLIQAHYALRVDIPVTPTAFQDARRLLGHDWKRGGDWHEYQNDDGDRYFSFTHKATGTLLRLVLRADLQGVTCERRQVGVKEVPIYEVICH